MRVDESYSIVQASLDCQVPAVVNVTVLESLVHRACSIISVIDY